MTVCCCLLVQAKIIELADQMRPLVYELLDCDGYIAPSSVKKSNIHLTKTLLTVSSLNNTIVCTLSVQRSFHHVEFLLSFNDKGHFITTMNDLDRFYRLTLHLEAIEVTRRLCVSHQTSSGV